MEIYIAAAALAGGLLIGVIIGLIDALHYKRKQLYEPLNKKNK